MIPDNGKVLSPSEVHHFRELLEHLWDACEANPDLAVEFDEEVLVCAEILGLVVPVPSNE